MAHNVEQRIIWQPDAMPNEEPREGKQSEFLNATEDIVLADGGKGGTELSTLIPTPQGFTTMGEIKIGDRAFDERGEICNVVDVSDIHFRKCYRIRFSDHVEIVVDDIHKWNTQTVKQRSKRLPQSVKTMPEIISSLRAGRKRKNHSIYLTKPLQLPEKKLPIDPWVLGYWLANGFSHEGRIVCGSSVGKEFEDRKEIEHNLTVAGYEHYFSRKSGGDADILRITGFTHLLAKNNLVKNKHIPKEYLRASEYQRLRLLQGLLDGDGGVRRELEVDFDSSNRNLRDDVYELASSLGMKCWTHERQGKLYGVDKKISYRIRIIPTMQVFTLSRKANALRIHSAQEERRKMRYIDSVEEILTVPTKCIEVDSPSHLYLVTEAMIPTHNSGKSDLLIFDALYPDKVNDPRWLGVIFRREYKRLSEIIDRAKHWTSKIPQLGAHWQGQDSRFIFPRGGRLAFHNVENIGDEEKYQGWEICDLKLDQVEEFPQPVYDYLLLQNRTGSIIKPTVRMTANPIGEFRGWIKKTLIDGKIPGQTYKLTQEHRGQIYTKTYKRIFMTVFDNPYLKNDIGYISTLANTRSPELRKAFLEGDWSVSVGQFFYDYMESVHVIPTRVLPKEWNRLGGLDYGNNKVLSIICSDDVGNIYDEWEFASLPYLQNDRMRSKTAGEFAEDSAEWMLTNDIGENLVVIGDIDVFSVKARDIGSDKTPEQFITAIWRKRFKKAGKKPPMLFKVTKKGNENNLYRVACNEMMKEYLRFKMDEQFSVTVPPKFFIFDRCKLLISTLPELVGSPDNMMDFVQYKGDAKNDHGYDSVKMPMMQILQSKEALKNNEDENLSDWMKELYGHLTNKRTGRNPLKPQRIR